MNKIVLADGYEIPNGSISVNGDTQIMVFYPGMDLAEALRLFGDPEKTKELTLYYSVYKVVYKGYMTVLSMTVDARGKQIQITLSGTEVSREESYTVNEMYLPAEMRKETENEQTDDAD